MEEAILNTVTFLGGLDFSIIYRVFLILFLVFWIFIVLWVWFDATERSKKIAFRLFSVLIVLFFNILGLIIYFLIRPVQSYEERYWQELEKKYLEFETSGLVNCSKCGFELESTFVNCPGCGKKLKEKCPRCEEFVEKYWKYCGYCGVKRIRVVSREKVEEEKKKINLKKEIYRKLSKSLCKIGDCKEECMSKIKKYIQKKEDKKSKSKSKSKKK